MVRDLAERRPGRACGDILRAATGTTRTGADLRHCISRAQFPRQLLDGKGRIVAASIAPAENVDSLSLEFADRNCASAAFVVVDLPRFDARHDIVPR